jgi:ABC-2 type transport system ATP-binding protein
MKVVTVNNISRNFGKVEALRDLSFEVDEGEIFGIIGPDGAGKTTLFRILTTLLLADSGTAIVDGCDIVKDYKKLRQLVGYMPGRFSLYQDLTVQENLKVFATVFNTTIEENYELIREIYQQIEPFKNRRAGALSGGMKQKLALCCALIHKPSVLFLDEPTTGVDPISRKDLWDMLIRLKKEKITILVSTPYMDEASLCDRIALIQNGRFLKTDTPANLTKQFDKVLWAVQAHSMSKLLTDLRMHEKVSTCFAFGETHHITLTDNELTDYRLTPDDLKKYLTGLGHTDIIVTPIPAGVEDCFMNLSAINDK